MTPNLPPLSSKPRPPTPGELVLAARAERAKRHLARRHLLAFGQYCWPGFEVRPHRALIAAALDGALERRFLRLMIFVPPQYGKSTLVSRNFPAWWLGKQPNERIILASYGAGLAFGFSREARNLLTTPAYAAVFGRRATYGEAPVELAPDSRAVDEWRLAPPYRGGLAAAGVGGGITGKTAHLAIIDDPLKGDVEARSETTRSAQKAWYQSDFSTRLDPNAVVVLCMTRWHEDDLAGWLLHEQARGADRWHVLRLPALAETAQDRKDWCERNHVDPDHYVVAAWDRRVPGSIGATTWGSARSGAA